MPTPYKIGGGTAGTGAASPLTFAVTQATTAGDVIVVGVGAGGATPTGVTDTKGNTYTLKLSDTTQINTYVFAALATTALTTSDTISVTFSAATSQDATAIGCSGLAAAPFDQLVSANSPGSTAPSVTSGTLAQASEVCIAFCTTTNTSGVITWTAPFTVLDNEHTSPTIYLGTAHNEVSSTSPVTAAGTIASSKWCAALVTLKVSVAGVAGAAPRGVMRKQVRPRRRRARIGPSGLQSDGISLAPGVISTIAGVTAPVTVTAVPGSFAGNLNIVQQVQGTSTFDYGLSTINLATPPTLGNTLILMAGWDLSTNPTLAPVPAAYVIDSAGNYWYHVQTSSATVPGARCAIWYCPNARPATWLSVSLTTFASSLAYTLIEIQNLPDNFSLDVADSNAVAAASSLTVNAGATGSPDLTLALLCTSAIEATVTQSAGWLPLTSVVSGAGNPNPVVIYPYWNVRGAGTSLSTTFTMNNTGAISGVIVGISTTAQPPVQVNPNFPIVKVEAAFGYLPGDLSQPPPTWTDITSRVVSSEGSEFISVTYGRQYELAQTEAGELTISLDNHDGAFTPGNVNSPFYPYVVLGTPIRVSAWWQGFWYYVGFGYTERWPQEWPELPQWGLSRLVAADAFAALASASLTSALEGDLLLDAPYVLIPASEQYTTFTNGINPFFTSADAQGFLAANESRSNQRAGVYVDGTLAPVSTGQSSNLLGTTSTGFGTTSISVAPTAPASGPGMVYTDPQMPGPQSPNGVTVEFWVLISAAATASNLQPTVFSAYGAPSNYFTAHPSLSVKINNFGGGATLTVTLIDGSTVSAPFNVSPNPQQIVLAISSSALSIYVNGGLQVTVTLSASQVSLWTSITLGCSNYAYQTGNIAVGNFIAFDLAVYPYQLPLQRVLSHYVTGSSGQQNVDATARLAEILAWGGLGFARGGQQLFGAPAVADGVTQGPAYDYSGHTAADAINQIALNHAALVAVAPSGALVFTHRWGLYNQPASVIFGDAPSPGAAEIPYLQATSWGFDNTYLYNVVQVSQQYGANSTITVSEADFTSQHMYFTRSALSQSISTMSNLDVYDLAGFQIAKYAQPQLRISQLTIDVSSNPMNFTEILQLQQGQAAVVTRRPVGGAVVSGPVLIQQISHAIGPATWKFSCQLSPYVPENAVLQLGVAGANVLGTQVLG